MYFWFLSLPIYNITDSSYGEYSENAENKFTRWPSPGHAERHPLVLYKMKIDKSAVLKISIRHSRLDPDLYDLVDQKNNKYNE